MSSRPRTTLKQKTPAARQFRATTSAMDSLRAHEKMSTLMPTVTRMVAIQKDCSDALPELFSNCAVLRFDSGQLVLSTPNAAVAARLKQNLPTLQDKLCMVGWQVSSIHLKVQPGKSVAPQPRQEKKPLSPQAITAFASLEKSIEKTPQNEALRAAINALMRRHQ
jgi:hypothetical protein